MPRRGTKKKSEASHFEKLFFLFELFFLREPQEWTIKDLIKKFQTKEMDCAPNTIRNLIEDLKRAMGENVIKEIKKGKKFYYYPTIRFQRKKPGDISNLSLVDYTNHSYKLEALMKALNEKIVCKVKYQGITGTPKEHFILPLKAISHHDVIYVYAWRYPELNESGHPFLLAFHRINSLNLLKNNQGEYVKINEYTPEQNEFLKKLAERCFGLIKKNRFKVRVQFDKSVETYLKERIWSEDQEYPTENELIFSATSKLEVKSWALSFGKNLVLIEPEDLRKEILEELEIMISNYTQIETFKAKTNGSKK